MKEARAYLARALTVKKFDCLIRKTNRVKDDIDDLTKDIKIKTYSDYAEKFPQYVSDYMQQIIQNH